VVPVCPALAYWQSHLGRGRLQPNLARSWTSSIMRPGRQQRRLAHPAACQENLAPGPLQIPDHPLVRQTLDDCLHEAMDINGLRALVAGIESGTVRVVVRDTTEPSVLAHEILNGRPFTYLDDAPLEERRSRAVQLRRGLPVQARDLGRLDPDAVERVPSGGPAGPA
jgi:hypothetical protein